METLYKAYKDRVQFFVVYIREAHPSRGSGSPASKRPASGRERPGARPGSAPRRRPGPDIAQPTTMKERMIAADKCMKGLKMTIPILLDSIEGTYLKAYGGFQAGTAVIDINGKIAYWTRGAPTGCKPKEAEKALKKLLADGGGAIPAKWAPVKLPPDPKAKPAAPAKRASKPADAGDK